MKVTTNAPHTAGQIEKAKTEQSVGEFGVKAKKGGESSMNEALRGGASVEISDDARLIHSALNAAKMAPEIRADRVQTLKKSIQDGTYKIDSAKVAEKLVEEHLGSDFGKNNL